MILGIGIDIIHLPRIQTLLTRKPTYLLHFSKRILSNEELKEFNNTFLSNRDNLAQGNLKQKNVMIDNNIIKFLAVRWTLKEAAYKALFPYYRLTWKDVSMNQIEGKPQLTIHGINSINNICSSVSHDGEYVISQVLIEGC